MVAQVVLKAATSRKPKVRYPAGPQARRLSRLRKFALAALMDRGIRKANKLTPAPKPNRDHASNGSPVGVFSDATGQKGL